MIIYDPYKQKMLILYISIKKGESTIAGKKATDYCNLRGQNFVNFFKKNPLTYVLEAPPFKKHFQTRPLKKIIF